MSLKLDRRAFIGTAVAAGATCAVNPASAFAVTAAQKKAEVQEIKGQLDAIGTELQVAVDKYNSANRTYEKATAAVKAQKKKIAAAQKKIEQLQGKLGNRATVMYRNGSTSYLDVLMGVSSFDDFATVWDTLNNLNEHDADLVLQTKTAKNELEEAKKELDKQQADAKDSRDSAASYKSSIEAKEAEYNQLYNSLTAEYQQLLAEEEEAREREAARAAAAYTPSGSSRSSSSSSSGGSSNSGGGNSGGGNSGGGNSGGGSSSSNSGGGDGGGDEEEEYTEESSDSGESEASYSGSSSANSGAVGRAESCLGLPYSYGSAGPSSYDCSGLVSYALTGSHSHVYVSDDFWSLPAVSDPQPGDVVACHAGHCGLYIGDGMMIEAPKPGESVRVAAVRGKIVRP